MASGGAELAELLKLLLCLSEIGDVGLDDRHRRLGDDIGVGAPPCERADRASRFASAVAVAEGAS